MTMTAGFALIVIRRAITSVWAVRKNIVEQFVIAVLKMTNIFFDLQLKKKKFEKVSKMSNPDKMNFSSS